LGLAAVLSGCGGPDLDDPETLDRILAEAVGEESLQYRDGLFYQNNEPYSGWAKGMYDSGQAKGLGQFKDGKQDGLEVTWWDNGQKLGEATYKNGKKEGSFRRWRENGKLMRETTYKNGEKISEKE
jgi:antitoxin component YwqK of YwqJK toxin-antitoxin module